MTNPVASPWIERAALLLVVALAGVLYFHRLGDVPVYVSTDEAKFAVQAHSLATTGRDMRGNLLPIFVLIVDPLFPDAQSVAWWQLVWAVLNPSMLTETLTHYHWSLTLRNRSTFGVTLVAVFILVPLPIVLAMPEAPFYATARAIPAIPFGVLIATAGLAQLNRTRSPLATAITIAMAASMPLQLVSFGKDYFGEYPQRSARWIDTMNDDIGEDKAVKWKFHLLASRRPDLWRRSQYLEPESASRSDIARGSVLLLSAVNPRVARLESEGWVLASVIRDAAGEPAAAILLKR